MKKCNNFVSKERSSEPPEPSLDPPLEDNFFHKVTHFQPGWKLASVQEEIPCHGPVS